MTLGSLTLKAVITNTKRDNTYNMTAYTVTLYSQSGQKVNAVITSAMMEYIRSWYIMVTGLYAMICK